MADIWTAPGFTHVRELGASGSGRVFQAVDDLTQTPVAIKYLGDQLRLNERFQKSFRSVARSLTMIEDPNLVQFYDYVESPEAAAIIMEFIEGVSLARLLSAQGPIGPPAALVVFSGSLMGLSAAHEAGVVLGGHHPANVLLDKAGTAKLTDIAITAQNGTKGRGAAYAAPEQWDGAPSTPAGDLYTATAVFFECLTGRQPYQEAKNTSALANAHRTAQVPVEAVPGPLRELIAVGLAKAPGDRPASATDFLAALGDAAVSAYGPAWEAQGRSHLAELIARPAATPSTTSSPSSPAQDDGPIPESARPTRSRSTQSRSARSRSARSRSARSRSARSRSARSRSARSWLIGAAAAVSVLMVAVLGGMGLGIGSGDTEVPAHIGKGSPAGAPATRAGTESSTVTGTSPQVTPSALANAIAKATAAKRGASFAFRQEACCGGAIAARGVFLLPPKAPVHRAPKTYDAYDMQVWSPVRADRYATKTRTILVGETAYVSGAGWRPVPAVRQARRAAGETTRTYASMAAQARWGTSVDNILALLRSTRTINRSGPTYSGTASLSRLTRHRSLTPLYAQFERAPQGEEVAFAIRVDRNFLPRELRVTVTTQSTGTAGSQVFRTIYSGWGRKTPIYAPG